MSSETSWEAGSLPTASAASIPIAESRGLTPRFDNSSLDYNCQVHSRMNCTVEVKGACRVEWPDLDGVAIHVQILNERGARFCCWMGCVVYPRPVAQNVWKLAVVDE